MFRTPRQLTAAAAAIVMAGAGLAAAGPVVADSHTPSWGDLAKTSNFERTATYPVFRNAPAGSDPAEETAAEIAGVSEDGMTVVYTDSPGKRIGFVDITNQHHPKGLGTVDLTVDGDAEDEPTSVYVAGDYVLVVVNTSTSYTETGGRLDVISMSTRERVASIDLGGQPDSIAVSADKKYAAVAIENERDEDATPEGGEEGALPQMPAGFVQVIDMADEDPTQWTAKAVKLTDEAGAPIPAMAAAGMDTPEDPEPEYVSINSRNVAAVSLQENNGLVLIDLASASVTDAFSLGNATFDGVDTEKDGLFDTTGSIDAPREPDAIGWIDDRYVGTANEGDYKGGTRGWSVVDTTDGSIAWDAGNTVENLATQYGLHNEKRAGKKGAEPEGFAVGTFGKDRLAFVAAERSNFVAVYNVNDPVKPVFNQMLPVTNGPEGVLPVPGRNMLVVASEVDDAGDGIRSTIQLFHQRPMNEDKFPSIKSAVDEQGMPIGWSALSGLGAHPTEAGKLAAVGDSAYDEGRIYTIDATDEHGPAIITDVTVVRDANGSAVEGLDLEGVTYRADGGYWVASEAKKPKNNALHQIAEDGTVVATVTLPTEITDHMGKWGLEGVASTGSGDDEVLYFVIQRPLWGDPKAKADPIDGANVARIGRYAVGTGEFRWYGYKMEHTSADGDWMGLSGIEVLADGKLAIIERDKGNGYDARVKRVYSVELPDEGAATGEAVTVLRKCLLVDALRPLQRTNGWTQEKIEGFAVDAEGAMFAVTDNDAVDDASGETVFLRWS